MCKAVLVMDMPKNCKDCIFIERDYICKIKVNYTSEFGRPDWCPMRELPKKKNYEKLSDTNPGKAWGNGWNDCLDEITGGEY